MGKVVDLLQYKLDKILEAQKESGECRPTELEVRCAKAEIDRLRLEFNPQIDAYTKSVLSNFNQWMKGYFGPKED